MLNPVEVNRNRPLIRLLQSGFPMVRQPYEALGDKLGVSGDDVTLQIERLKDQGLVRQIGPVIDGRLLGYHTTLVAMQIPRRQLDATEKIIKMHPRISHAYERENAFNVWVTLAAQPGVAIESEVERLAAASKAATVVSMPALKIFKLRVNFGPDDDEPVDAPGGKSPAEKLALSNAERLLVNELQQDLPLCPEPFADMAERLGMKVENFLSSCHALQRNGVIRRYGASINHRRAGYSANAMACWRVDPGRVDSAAAELTAKTCVSHCYERRTSPSWRYNLFAMIHGAAREDCLAVAGAAKIADELNDGAVLFSTREIKKVRIRYEVPE